MIDIKKALNYIPPAILNYEEWLAVGMALKSAAEAGEDVSFKDWDDWSLSDSDRYKPGLCEQKWKTFNSTGITKATLIAMAMDHGFNPIESLDETFDWDDLITVDNKPKPNNDFELFLKALFKPDENVSFCIDAYEENGKWRPANGGLKGVKASVLTEDFKRNHRLTDIFAGYNPRAGGWIRFNPLDGKDVKKENVTDFRYVLVESDEISLEEQYKKILSLRLPCVALIYSGSRSIHGIMHVDAKNQEQYRERVEWIFKVLNDNGYPVDTANKNANRFTRIPGLKRGDKTQTLIDLNVGYKTFNEWKEFVENGLEDIDLPEIEALGDVWDNRPELAPELIEGVLRQGHKMLLAGSSKAGKSFSLIELAIAIAEGTDWFGFKVNKGKVLYINLEIDRPSFIDRIAKVYEAKGLEPKHLDDFTFWNLRGKAAPMNKLTPKIISRIRDENYTAIILDPIYKVQSGDENSAGDIGKFTNEFDRICAELGVSMIYCHHHSKGTQGHKRAIDRSSGSGVFARDPDAILDLIELSNETYRMYEDLKDLSAWRVEGTLREFKPFKPRNLFFDFPVHKVDEEGYLTDAEPKSELSHTVKTSYDPERNLNMVDEAFYACSNVDGNHASEKDMINYLGNTPETFRKKINKYNKERGKTYLRQSGMIIKLV